MSLNPSKYTVSYQANSEEKCPTLELNSSIKMQEYPGEVCLLINAIGMELHLGLGDLHAFCGSYSYSCLAFLFVFVSSFTNLK